MSSSSTPKMAARSIRRSLSTSPSTSNNALARVPPPHIKEDGTNNEVAKRFAKTGLRTAVHPDARPLEENVRPDIPHPSYRPGQVMRLVDKPSVLPPKLAYERLDRLAKAREVGLQWNKVYVTGKEKPRQHFPAPLVPVSLKDRDMVRGERSEVEKVEYEVGRGAETMEKREFFVEDVDSEIGQVVDWAGAEVVDEVPGLEAGRIIECRR
jgi:hypothetical protein